VEWIPWVIEDSKGVFPAKNLAAWLGSGHFGKRKIHSVAEGPLAGLADSFSFHHPCKLPAILAKLPLTPNRRQGPSA